MIGLSEYCWRKRDDKAHAFKGLSVVSLGIYPSVIKHGKGK
jgi:hypothetical protein